MKKILLVDDSIFMRKLIREMIEGDNYCVISESSSGLSAVENYFSVKPDLVLMDYNMPGMDGMEAIRCILESDPKATIVMITSLDSAAKMEEARQIGIKGYLVKPFTREDILAKLADAFVSESPL